MARLVKDKTFYKTLLSIALPIAMQNLITTLTSMMDTIMVGKLGEVQLSASSIANQVFFVFMVLTMGIASGTNILIAQYWGKGDVRSINQVLSIMYKVTAALSLIFFVAVVFIPGTLMGLFTNDQAVIAEGIRYLKTVSVIYLLFGFSNATICMLRAVGTVKISLVVYSTSLIVNVVLNYILIFGKFGAPKMGVVGAALATAIARIIEFIIVIVYMAFYESKIRLQLRELLRFDGTFLKDFLQNASPVVFNEFIWAMGNSVIAAIIGRMGTAYVAANSICSVVFQFVTVFIFGMGHASAVITGNTIGAGRYKEAKAQAHTLTFISILVGVTAGVLMIAVRPLAISFYSVSDSTKALASQIMIVTGIMVMFTSVAVVNMMGILRGGGDAKFVLVTDVIFTWVICIPLGALAGLVWHWPVMVTYAILKGEDLFKVFISSVRIRQGKWVRDVTRQQPADELPQ